MSYLWSWTPKPDLEQISVHLESGNKVSVKLKLDDILPIIREKLASNTEIKMDEKLLFYSEEKGIISSESEGEYKLREIVNKQCVLVLKIKLWKSLNEKFSLDHGCRAVDDEISRANKRAFNLEQISVHFLESGKKVSVKLKLDDSLSIIRKKLASNTEIKMDEKLLFYSEEKGIISSESESEYKLGEIVNKQYVLFLKIKLWKSLNEKFSLDHGCRAIDDEILRANKRAFTMTDCEVSPCLNYRSIKNNNTKHQKAETSLSGNADFSIISFGILGNKGNEAERNSSDETNYYSRSCLEFEKYLEPTEDFIEEVKGIKDSKTFKVIIEKFGLFIPTKVTMGGKISKKEGGTSKNESKGISADAGFNTNVAGVSVGIGVGASLSNLKESSSQHGEESYDGIGKSDDEQSRNESLNDEKNWVCIRHENCINIFELLTNNPKYNYLRKEIFSAIGQRILYSDIETCDYTLNGRKPYFGKFEKIPSDILNRADCYIFAVILDAKDKKNDFFNCQICLQDGTPMYIVHCIQMERQMFFNFSSTLDKCELKIKYMIVGNYTDFNSIKYDELNSDIQLEVIKKDFNDNQTKCSNKELLGFKSHPFIHFIGIPVLNDLNQGNSIIGHHFYTDRNNNVGVFTFSYSLDQKKYVNLPNFSFYTLKISNVKIGEFDHKNICEIYSEINHPKYFSLRSEIDFGPIFFKYTNHQIKLKVINCGCKRCDVCKDSLKISKDKINFRYVHRVNIKISQF